MRVVALGDYVDPMANTIHMHWVPLLGVAIAYNIGKNRTSPWCCVFLSLRVARLRPAGCVAALAALFIAIYFAGIVWALNRVRGALDAVSPCRVADKRAHGG
jgi:hypothetical protein